MPKPARQLRPPKPSRGQTSPGRRPGSPAFAAPRRGLIRRWEVPPAHAPREPPSSRTRAPAFPVQRLGARRSGVPRPGPLVREPPSTRRRPPLGPCAAPPIHPRRARIRRAAPLAAARARFPTQPRRRRADASAPARRLRAPASPGGPAPSTPPRCGYRSRSGTAFRGSPRGRGSRLRAACGTSPAGA